MFISKASSAIYWQRKAVTIPVSSPVLFTEAGHMRIFIQLIKNIIIKRYVEKVMTHVKLHSEDRGFPGLLRKKYPWTWPLGDKSQNYGTEFG